MSMHSSENTDPTPHGEDPTTDAVTQLTEEEQSRIAEQERYLEELREGRADNSGGWSDIRSGEVPVVRVELAAAPEPARGVIDPDREQLEGYSAVTEEQRATGRERLRDARAALGRAQRRVGVRAVTASDLIESPSLGNVGEVLDEHEQWRVAKEEARRLSIETGESHRVLKDAHGNYVVEPAFKKRK